MFIIKFFSLVIDLKMFGGRVVEQIFSDKLSVAIFLANVNVSGWMAAIELCCRFSSSKFICFWNISAWSSLNSLCLRLSTLRFAKALNESSSIFRRRLADKSKFVNFERFWKSSGEKFVSLLSSNWRIRSDFKFIIACGWITKMWLLLRFNSSKQDWCWNIFWHTMPRWFSLSDKVFKYFKGRKVSQWRFLIWFFCKLNFSRFPGPTKASLSISVNKLFSIDTSSNMNDLRKSFGGNAVNWLLFKLTNCNCGKSVNVSDESSFNPASSKLTTVKFWNLWITSCGMVLNSSCLMWRYLMLSSRIFFVLMMTFSVPMEILQESRYFTWL